MKHRKYRNKKIKETRKMIKVTTSVDDGDEDDGEPLSPMARVFQWPGNDCCIVTKIGCKTKINAQVILRALRLNVSKHPRFSSKLSSDGASWIKTQVNVEEHVTVVDIDPKEIGEDGASYVEDYVSNLTVVPLDKSRPLWDIHILNVKTSDAEAVCVMRSHHSLGDGTSLMSLLLACTQYNTSLHDIDPSMKRHKTVHKDKASWWSISAISSFGRLILNTFLHLSLLLATALFLKDTNTPIKADVDVENNQKKICHRIISLDDIKLIKEVMNMTINDVLLGVTQAALSRYMQDFPGKVRLTASVFINLRSKNGIQPLSDMMAKNSKCRWGNYFTAINFPISIGLETDPLVYLSKAKSAMDPKKHSFVAVLAYSFIMFIFYTFGAKVSAILLARFVSNTTTSISNMIGPMEEIHFDGHTISYIATSVYGHSQALTIHFVSYAEKMVISIAVDPTVISNPHKLCDEMEDSLKVIKAALTEKGLL